MHPLSQMDIVRSKSQLSSVYTCVSKSLGGSPIESHKQSRPIFCKESISCTKQVCNISSRKTKKDELRPMTPSHPICKADDTHINPATFNGILRDYNFNLCKTVQHDGECFIVVWQSTSLEDLVDASIPFSDMHQPNFI